MLDNLENNTLDFGGCPTPPGMHCDWSRLLTVLWQGCAMSSSGLIGMIDSITHRGEHLCPAASIASAPAADSKGAGT